MIFLYKELRNKDSYRQFCRKSLQPQIQHTERIEEREIDRDNRKIPPLILVEGSLMHNGGGGETEGEGETAVKQS